MSKTAFLILSALAFIVLVGFECGTTEVTPPPPVEEPIIDAGEPIAGKMPGNACFDAGAFSCSPDDCEGETLELPAGTNMVCCDKPCKGAQEVEAVEGDENATCAAQKGNDCGVSKTCPDKQWLKSSDAARCCKATCIDRIQTTVTIDGLGEVVIERLKAGEFGVFYGQGAKIGSIDLGRTAYASAKSVGNNEYEFMTSDGRKFKFKIKSESDTAISAEAIKPTSAEAKAGCVMYFERKSVGSNRPPVIILPVPKQCIGKQCVLRLKLNPPVGPTPMKQVMYSQIDNAYTISGGEEVQNIPIPSSGINGDAQQNYILFGPAGCILLDDYPNIEQTKEKFVLMPPKLEESISCQLEVCSG